MRKMKYKKGILLVFVFLLGCSDQKIIEKTGFVRSIAYDVANNKEGDDLIKLTISIPKSNEKEALIYSTNAKTSREARMIFDRQNNRKIVNGQVRQVLFGDKFAKKGIWKHIDALVRDPSVGNRLHVLVVEESANKLLSRTYPQGQTVGEYIDDLIRTEANTNDIPFTNLYSFARDYYDDGTDPVCAIINETKDSLIIDGIALFRNDQYVAKIKPEDKMFFALLHDNLGSGNIYMDLSEIDQNPNEQAALLYISSKRKIHIVSSPDTLLHGGKLMVSIDINIIGSLLEYSGELNMKNNADQKELESKMSALVEKKSLELVDIMKKNKVDPLGIGQYARNIIPYSEWLKLPQRSILSDADYTIHAKVKIKDFGRLQQ
ncbi:Ger(x)C family spore germination protein [Paenibacillus sp. LMG 31457]|uniref:Ger(X)C family spore germination protein n=2 Tax=Paenibacillus planticolens TaxID=2654976 RepID=A0ABX1ZQ90_9BACL|nr:Ger(x)C family spore germination protein [Paenibacillus planticolens]